MPDKKPVKSKILEVAVCYPRQSKTDAEELIAGVSLSSETQIAKAAAFADLHGWAFDRELSEASADLDTTGGAKAKHRKSGKATWQRRPGLMRLLEAATLGKFQHLICYKLDRLGRDAAELHQIRDAFHDAGVVIHVVSEGIRSDTAGGELVFGVLASVAQMERRQISDRLRDVSFQRAKRGLHHSRPPAWLEIVDGTTPADGAAHYRIGPYAETLLRLIEYRLSGLTYTEIARALNAEGVRNVRSTRFTRQAVQDALSVHNRLRYRGYAVYGKELQDGDPLRILTPNVFPPLLTIEEADALDSVQTTLQSRSTSAALMHERSRKGAIAPYKRSAYLCSGLMRCAICGASMIGKANASRPDGAEKARMYYCRESVNSETPHPGRVLATRRGGMYIGSQRIESAVVNAIALLQLRIWDKGLLPPPKRGRKPSFPTLPRSVMSPEGKPLTPPRRTAKDIETEIDMLFQMLSDKEILKGDFDRRYEKLKKERADIESYEAAKLRQDEKVQAMERLSLPQPVVDWQRIELRLFLHQLVDYIAVPLTFDGVNIARVRDNTDEPLLEHVRIVLKEPLPDGTTSILSAMYRSNYKGNRRILFEIGPPPPLPDTFWKQGSAFANKIEEL